MAGLRVAKHVEAEEYKNAEAAIRVCQEVAEGVRVMADFYTGKLLLYPEEKHQYAQHTCLKPLVESVERQQVGTGDRCETPTLSLPSLPQYPTHSKSLKILTEHVFPWRLVPESLYSEDPIPCSLVYGGIHLARLLVRIPDILDRMTFDAVKARNIRHHLQVLEQFLTSQPDIFVDASYQ